MSFFEGVLSFPSTLIASSLSSWSLMSSSSSSSKSIRMLKRSCMSTSSAFASFASFVFPSFTRALIAFFFVVDLSQQRSCFFAHCFSSVFLNSIHVQIAQNFFCFVCLLLSCFDVFSCFSLHSCWRMFESVYHVADTCCDCFR